MMNYNMQGIEKTIPELFAMLKVLGNIVISKKILRTCKIMVMHSN